MLSVNALIAPPDDVISLFSSHSSLHCRSPLLSSDWSNAPLVMLAHPYRLPHPSGSMLGLSAGGILVNFMVPHLPPLSSSWKSFMVLAESFDASAASSLQPGAPYPGLSHRHTHECENTLMMPEEWYCTKDCSQYALGGCGSLEMLLWGLMVRW